jgi:5-methylcytosine-specific restriction endonuclease McrA
MQRGNVILRTKRKTIQANVRRSICNDQNNTCKQCEKELTEFYHIDHVVALRFGGTNEYENLQALCAECHCIKSTLESKLNLEIQTSIQNIINNYRPQPCNQT